jgi:hypothetical protein
MTAPPPHSSPVLLRRALARLVQSGWACPGRAGWPVSLWLASEFDVPGLWQGAITLPDYRPGAGAGAASPAWAGQIEDTRVLGFQPEGRRTGCRARSRRSDSSRAARVRVEPDPGLGDARPCNLTVAA